MDGGRLARFDNFNRIDGNQFQLAANRPFLLTAPEPKDSLSEVDSL